MEKAILERNISKAIRFEREPGDNGKAKVFIDAAALEVEVFVRIKGLTDAPTLLGTYPVSQMNLGEDE